MTDKNSSTKTSRKKKRLAEKKHRPSSNAFIDKTSERSNKKSFPIVGLGASAGGLEAFESFIGALPEDSGMACILVSHLDPYHVSLLPELLQKNTRIPVHQITDGTKVEPNNIYVIPPNKELYILHGVLQLVDLTQPRGFNLPIDSFFRSLSEDQGPNAIGIILSGTGTDGTLGLKAIKGELGLVMVQDEKSAKYDGMPRSAISTGLADYVLPADKMPAQLLAYTQYTIKHKSTPNIDSKTPLMPDVLQKIFIILRSQTGHDFSQYKKNTIYRRIERRMNLHQMNDLNEYLAFIQHSDREANNLYKELLIGVTNFFRDPEAFEVLQNKILPDVLAGKPDGYTLRVWVSGCSTGEEAYSIAILLKEYMEHNKHNFNVQIFGTDIDEDAVNTARAGIYPKSIIADVGATRLKRNFTEEQNGQYKINKSIREMLVFATQNIIKDPPFTKMDLLCCRNLLIYFGPELQKKLLPAFYYSLKPDGILFLGSSETIGQSTDLFLPLDQKWKIFQRKSMLDGTRLAMEFSPRYAIAQESENTGTAIVKNAEELSALQLIETILKESDAPPSAIIDSGSNIVYIHGHIGDYLEPAEGKINTNIIEMARPGLKSELAASIRKVGLHKQAVSCNGLRVPHNDGYLSVDLTVKPIMEQSNIHGMMMVIFQSSSSSTVSKQKPEKKPAISTSGKSVIELEEDLRYTKETLQTTIEELETSNEELKSTNEELQSTNEELQSTNEELETSKEELQSLNEESATVNVELQSRIDELSQSNDDMKNLLESTEVATIFLDSDLNIRRFTKKATDIIPLVEIDSGRPLNHFASNIIDADLSKYASKVLDDLIITEKEVQSKNGKTYLLRIRPYRTVNNIIDGVVLTFYDVTQRKHSESELKQSESRLLSGFQATNDAVWDYNLVEDSLWWNPGYNDLFGKQPATTKNSWQWRMEHVHPDERDKVVASIQTAINGKEDHWKYKFRYRLENGNYAIVIDRAYITRDEDGRATRMLGAMLDITPDNK